MSPILRLEGVKVSENETLKQRRARRSGPQRGRVEVRAITADEEFAYRNADRKEQVTRSIEDETQGLTEGGNVTHFRAGRVTM